METRTFAFGIILASALISSCSITSTTYEPSGYTYTYYNVGYNPYTYNSGHYPGYRRYYYDSAFYVRDEVYNGPGFRRGYWRGW